MKPFIVFLKEESQETFYRMANDNNKITDDIRGGTWFANENNLGDLKKYVTSGQ